MYVYIFIYIYTYIYKCGLKLTNIIKKVSERHTQKSPTKKDNASKLNQKMFLAQNFSKTLRHNKGKTIPKNAYYCKLKKLFVICFKIIYTEISRPVANKFVIFFLL